MTDFNKVIDRTNHNSIKWTGMDKRGFKTNELLPLWIADMDFMSSPSIVKEIKEKAEHGIYGYTFVEDSYYDLPANWTKKHFDYDLDPNTLLYTHGMLFSVVLALKLFSQKGDGVIVNTPSYPPFLESVIKSQRNLIVNELIIKDNKYCIDFDLLEKQASDQNTKWYIISNPHNPTGRVWTKEELTKISEICLKHNVRIINDEAWRDLVFSESKLISLPSISKEVEDICITCFAPTKTFNLAGLQTSFVSLPRKEEKEQFKSQMQLFHLDNMSYFAHIATKEAYTNSENWMKELLSYLEENRNNGVNFVKNKLSKAKIIKPEATYVLWIDLRDYNIPKLNDFMQDKAKVAVNSGKAFGEIGEGFIRINFACPKQTLEEGLNRIQKALEG